MSADLKEEIEALAVAYIASGAHGFNMDLKLSDEEIRTVVTRAVRVWREIQRQLSESSSLPG